MKTAFGTDFTYTRNPGGFNAMFEEMVRRQEIDIRYNFRVDVRA